MQIQYASFTTLVLHQVHGSSPIWPFDPSSGSTVQPHSNNIGYHYHDSVYIQELNNLGYAISHYQDNDSRRVCCLRCDDDSLLTEWPNLLVDAVEQGLAAFGGRVLTPTEARDLARHLEPDRTEEWDEPDPENPGSTIHYTKTIGQITLDASDFLTRTVDIVQS